jgi:hypothetical protein
MMENLAGALALPTRSACTTPPIPLKTAFNLLIYSS